jgi:hypothetical protein
MDNLTHLIQEHSALPDTSYDKQRQLEFEAAKYVVDTLKAAEDYSLQVEVMVFFLRNMQVNFHLVEQAAFEARLEWDF